RRNWLGDVSTRGVEQIGSEWARAEVVLRPRLGNEGGGDGQPVMAGGDGVLGQMAANLPLEIELHALSFLEHAIVVVVEHELEVGVQRERLNGQVLQFQMFVGGKETAEGPVVMRERFGRDLVCGNENAVNGEGRRLAVLFKRVFEEMDGAKIVRL